MTLSRLLLPKPPSFHFHRTGLIKSTRCCSSSSSSSSGETQKFSQAKKAEKRSEAVETYVETYPPVFPNATKVTNNVGGSWYSLKGIFTSLKDKMLGNPQLPKQITGEGSDSEVGLTASKAIMTQDNRHTAESGEAQRVLQSSEVESDPHSAKKSNAKSKTSHILEEDFSKDVVHIRASEVREMDKCPDNFEVSKPERTVQSSKVLIDSISNNKSISTSVLSHIVGENSSESLVDTIASEVGRIHNSLDNFELCETENMVQSSEAIRTDASYVTGKVSSDVMVKSEDISDRDNARLARPKNGHGQLEEAISGRPVGFFRDQETEADLLTCLSHLVVNETSKTLEKDSSNELTSIGNGNCQLEKTAIFGQTAIAGSNVDQMPASSDGSQMVMGIADLFTRTNSDRAVGEMTGKKSMAPSESLDNLNGTSGEDAAGGSHIRGLIDCIKGLPRDQPTIKSQESTISSVTNQVSKGGSTKMIQPRDNLKNSGVKRGQTSLKGHAMGKEIKKFNEKKKEPSRGNEGRNLNIAADGQMKSEPNSDIKRSHTSLKGHAVGKGSNEFNVEKEEPRRGNGEGSNLNIAADDQKKSEPSLLPTSKEGLNQTPGTSFTEEESLQNKLLVRFLNKRVESNDISSAFNHCGSIVKIELVSPDKDRYFKDAFVYFQTKEGLQKALEKTDLIVRNTDAIVEATSLEDMPSRISIPNLIGDTDVPVALVKNPTRTVKIKQLTHDTSSHHLKEALAFCGCGIASCFLGSSSSVAYVEFETEDAKERAVARHSIDVLGKRLLIFRIDAPRTTIIRISNITPKLLCKIGPICNSYGKVKNVFPRSAGIVDVHFKLHEWPNMLNILNSLNGLEVEDSWLLAQPAPAFPPEILQVLWSQPDERRHVKAVIRKLARNLDLDLDTAELHGLVGKYYGDGF